MSPGFTLSPTAFFHLPSEPSDMVGEREGIGTTWCGGTGALTACIRVCDVPRAAWRAVQRGGHAREAAAEKRRAGAAKGGRPAASGRLEPGGAGGLASGPGVPTRVCTPRASVMRQHPVKVVRGALQSTLLCRRLAAYLPVTHHAAVSCHAAEAAPRRSTGTLRAASRAALAPHSPPERTQAPSAAKLEHRSAARAAARRIVRGQSSREERNSCAHYLSQHLASAQRPFPSALCGGCR